ncbi:MAG TPA: ribosome maturation factor RimP [Holophagaceae bacterium]|nr:ribosome maturation factor RimP [Holophagaceae bacterium]
MDLTKLQAPLERQLSLLGYELVHLETAREAGDDILRLFVDHLDSEATGRRVTLDDCVAVNEGLMAWMDVEFPSLRETTSVEVSSPGMERPLSKADHFRRFAGRLCRLQTRRPVNGQKRFKGWIAGVADGIVTIEEDGALKAVPIEDLQKARLAPFDEDKTPRPKHLAAVTTPAPDMGFDDDGVETSAGQEN